MKTLTTDGIVYHLSDKENFKFETTEYGFIFVHKKMETIPTTEWQGFTHLASDEQVDSIVEKIDYAIKILQQLKGLLID